MKFDIGAVFEQLVMWYVKLPIAQKIALPLLIAGSMGVTIFVSRWASVPEYRVLFSNLEEADAAAIVEKLKDSKVSFRLRDDGRTIDITPAERVHELRLEMAQAGIPRGGSVGYELFNESSLGQTGLAERVKLMRAKQGALERTIQSIEGVKSVRVHISEPERSVFVKQQAKPTASVLIRLEPGAELTGRQVKGVAHLVASSVERLEPSDVTVIDSHGNLLNEKRDQEETGGADLTRLDYQRQIEMAYIKRVETMLAEILGPGKAAARVTAELDFNKYEKEEEAFDPAGIVTRSERSVEESAGGSAEGGVPGVLSNLTNDTDLLNPPDSSQSGNVRTERVKNYEVSKAVSRTVQATGKVMRLSVAVLVDGTYKPKADGVEGEKQYEPLAPAMLKKIENLVKQSVGFDGSRGDIVTVENIRFFEPDQTLEQLFVEAQSGEALERWAPFGFSILALGALFILLWRLLNYVMKPSDSEVDLTRLLPAGVDELEAELEVERRRLNNIPQLNEPGVDLEELEKLLAENSRIVKDNPQQAALLIRYWLNEGSM